MKLGNKEIILNETFLIPDHEPVQTDFYMPKMGKYSLSVYVRDDIESGLSCTGEIYDGKILLTFSRWGSRCNCSYKKPFLFAQNENIFLHILAAGSDIGNLTQIHLQLMIEIVDKNDLKPEIEEEKILDDDDLFKESPA